MYGESFVIAHAYRATQSRAADLTNALARYDKMCPTTPHEANGCTPTTMSKFRYMLVFILAPGVGFCAWLATILLTNVMYAHYQGTCDSQYWLGPIFVPFMYRPDDAGTCVVLATVMHTFAAMSHTLTPLLPVVTMVGIVVTFGTKMMIHRKGLISLGSVLRTTGLYLACVLTAISVGGAAMAGIIDDNQTAIGGRYHANYLGTAAQLIFVVFPLAYICIVAIFGNLCIMAMDLNRRGPTDLVMDVWRAFGPNPPKG